MYELTSDRIENNRRTKTYLNKTTSSETKTIPIYTDKAGVQWWGFLDLYKIPYIRSAMAKHVSDMFTMGLSLKDILEWCAKEKALLKSDDVDKYEKLFALVLEKERLATYTADPVRQHLALCTIYVLREEERIDYFNDEQAQEKLMLWGADMEATSFFLNWHTKAIEDFTENFLKLSQTVSAREKQLNELLHKP